MADYNQPDYVEKRVRYFDGQFLKDQDFVDEQKYLIDRQRRYHRFLNISGIVDGLAVKVKPGTTDLVTVDPGTALDNKGRQIVLSDLGPETDRQIPLQSLRGATADLVIIYNEEGSDQAQAGSAGFTRFYEKPQLTTVPSGQTAPDGAVTLARLTVSGTGGVEVNNTVRIYAGVCMPYDGAGPGAGPTLRAGSTSRLDVTGDLTISGNVGIGTTTPKGFQVVLPESNKGGAAPGPGVTIAGGPNGNAGIELRNNGSGTPFIDFAQAGTGTDYDARIRLTAPGKLAIEGANVGIGTTDPGAFRLKVEGGDTSLGGALTIGRKDTIAPHMINLFQGAASPDSGFLTFGDGSGWKFHVGKSSDQGATKFLTIQDNGNVGIGTTDPGASKLKVDGTLIVTGSSGLSSTNVSGVLNVVGALNVTGGAISPAAGNSESAGIMFPQNPGGGAGDAAWVRYYAREGEKTTLEIGVSNDAEDHIALMASGNVGIGIISPDDKLDVAGNLRILTGSNPIRFTSAWSGFPDGTDVTNQAEISNDTSGYKTLMIIGNKSNDKATRRVSVWDRLEVNGTLHVTSGLSVDSGKAVSGIPIIDFQSQMVKFQDHRGGTKLVVCTFTFGRPVEKAEAMLRSWYLTYQNRELVKEAQVACAGMDIKNNTVTVDVLFGLKDASGEYDDFYSGSAQVVVIAKLSQSL